VGQDSSAGPFGPGSFSPYDWCLINYYGASFMLIGPGNIRYYFGNSLGNNQWSDTRDPEMRGAVLTVNWSTYDPLQFKDGTVWHFNNQGDGGLVDVIDPHGNPVLSRTDDGGCRTVSVSAGGKSVNYTYSGGHVTNAAVTCGTINKNWSFTYGSNGEVSTITDPLGHVTTLAWTSYTRFDGKVLPLLSSVTDPRGNLVYSNQYDSSGRVIQQTYADGGYTSVSYSSLVNYNRTTTVTDPRGGVSQYNVTWGGTTYSSQRDGYLLNQATDPLGRTTTWHYNSANFNTQIVDYRGRATNLTWDSARGNLLSRSWTTPLNNTATESFSYDAGTSALVSSTDALGRVATNTVNAYGDVLTTTDARSQTTTFTRNSMGEAYSIKNALNQITTPTYGSSGELLTSTDSLNHTTTRTYDAAARLLTLKDANGKQVSLTYDLMDRLLTQSQTVNGQALTTTNVYDADGNRTQMTDPKGQIWQWSFDNKDRVATETDPNGKVITYSYDLNNNVAGWTDRAGNSAAFTYDAANRPLTKTFTRAGGGTDSTVTYNYDPTTHLLTSVVDSAAPGNQTWSYVYDSLDRIKQVNTPNGTINIGLNDKLNRRDSVQAGAQGTITYTFDNDDNMVSIAQNGATASLTYDALNRLTQQSLPAIPNPVTTARSFDSAGRLSSLTSSCNGSTLDSHTYTRDAVGNLTQEVIGGANPSTSSFGYDDLYRLTSATVNGTSYSYAYDQVGNRTSQTAGGVVTNYTYDSADHLTAVNANAVTSDANGSITQDDSGGPYSWDVRGRLVGLTKNGSLYAFSYGPNNLRLAKTVNGVLTAYLLDGDQVVTDTINGAANQTLY
jgi:YD repeat-containing protein